MTKPTTTNLTDPERLVLARRRMDVSGPTLAMKLGLRRHDLQNMELGTGDMAPQVMPLIRSVTPKTVTIPELCFIARRRAGMNTTEVAKKVKLSRQWVCTMERGHTNSDQLAAYWGL